MTINTNINMDKVDIIRKLYENAKFQYQEYMSRYAGEWTTGHTPYLGQMIAYKRCLLIMTAKTETDAKRFAEMDDVEIIHIKDEDL